MKYYEDANDEGRCYRLGYFKDFLKFKKIEKIILREKMRDIGGDMWCWVCDSFVSSGDCGKICKFYDPRNGKSGRCRNLENGFVDTGRIFELTKDGLKEVTK